MRLVSWLIIHIRLASQFENSRYSQIFEFRARITWLSSSRYMLIFSSNGMWAVLYNKIQFCSSLASLFPLLLSLLSSRLNCSFRRPAQWVRDLEQTHLTCQHCNSSNPFFKFYFIVCSELVTKTIPFMKILYSSDPYYVMKTLYSSYYVHGTFARYSCTKNQRLTPGHKVCSNGSWLGPEPRNTMCGKCLWFIILITVGVKVL